jgi:minimal PKS acyl carrier protein
MEKLEFTIGDLTRILRESAGASEDIDLDGHILDTEFTALGYDSLALMETGSRIERQYAIRLGDEALATAATPRDLLETVNTQLAGRDAALEGSRAS